MVFVDVSIRLRITKQKLVQWFAFFVLVCKHVTFVIQELITITIMDKGYTNQVQLFVLTFFCIEMLYVEIKDYNVMFYIIFYDNCFAVLQCAAYFLLFGLIYFVTFSIQIRGFKFKLDKPNKCYQSTILVVCSIKLLNVCMQIYGQLIERIRFKVSLKMYRKKFKQICFCVQLKN